MSSASSDDGRAPARPRKRQSPEQTREALVGAALTVFNEVAFHDTDTNKIARAAGFSPGTFYRHFPDKRAIFLAAYARFRADEQAAVDASLARTSSGEKALDAILVELLAHHARFRVFRRNLRVLVAQDDEVRAAYAASNLEALTRDEEVSARLGASRHGKARALVQRLAIERLCDAVVDGDFAALCLSERELRRVIGRFFSGFLGR